MAPKKYQKRKTCRRVKGELPIYKPERGCTRQFTKKYTSRSSPAYPANQLLCRDKVKKGNDNKLYRSEKEVDLEFIDGTL